MELELYDKAAERAVISGIIKGGADCFVEIDDIISSDTFYVDSNQVIFKCVKHALEQGAEKLDVSTILSSAKSINLGSFFETEQELKHLRSVMSMQVEQNNIRKLAGKIGKLQFVRGYIGQLEMSIEELKGLTGDEPIDQILSMPENRLTEYCNSLRRDENNEPKSMASDIDAWVEHLASNPIEQVGLKGPFSEWDKAIGGGIRPASVNVIGARPKVGKTTLGITYANHFAGENIPCLYLDTEMLEDAHRIRTLSMLSGVYAEEVETGKFGASKQKRAKIDEAAKKMKKCAYDMKNIAGQPFEETISVMRRWLTKRVGYKTGTEANDCVIIFDYLKLMESSSISKHLQEYQALGFMMTALHNFSVKYKVPILLFIQLNRDGVDVENSTAASGSDRIIWLCSNFTIYKKISDEERAAQSGQKNKYNRKMVIPDTRYGPGLDPDTFLALNADMNCFKITEIGIKSNDQSAETGDIEFS